MRSERLPLALIALIGIVAVVPAWMFVTGPMTEQLPSTVQFLANAALPLIILLLIASWLDPRGV